MSSHPGQSILSHGLTAFRSSAALSRRACLPTMSQAACARCRSMRSASGRSSGSSLEINISEPESSASQQRALVGVSCTKRQGRVEDFKDWEHG